MRPTIFFSMPEDQYKKLLQILAKQAKNPKIKSEAKDAAEILLAVLTCSESES